MKKGGEVVSTSYFPKKYLRRERDLLEILLLSFDPVSYQNFRCRDLPLSMRELSLFRLNLRFLEATLLVWTSDFLLPYFN